MKLKQNAQEIVLLSIEGLGLILGEIRYNRQTETAIFALEKAAFFDVYFPCTVIYDQQKGPLVHPHILAAMTTSSIRVQRQKVACYIIEKDLNPMIVRQYQDLLHAVLAPMEPIQEETQLHEKEHLSPKTNKKEAKRIIDLTKLREKIDK